MRLNRRSFLKTTGGALTASVGMLGPLGNESARAFRAASPNEAIRCGMIGLGGRGQGLMTRLADEQRATVTAVCDVNERNRRQAAETLRDGGDKAAKQFGDFRRLLEDEDIDAILIATPHHWHCPIAIRALQASKHVYVEKPASHVFREGRLLIEAARKYDRVVQHGTQMRSSEVTQKAGEVLANGVLGEIQMARGWSVEPRRHSEPVADQPPPDYLDWTMWLGPAPQRAFNPLRLRRWRWFRDYGNGEIGDDGIHDLDMTRWGLGAEEHPSRIAATGSRINLKGQTEYPNHLTVSYQYADGRELLYETRNWAPYKQLGFDSGNAFYGTEGYMIFSRRGHFQTYLGAKQEQGPGMKGSGGTGRHLQNFLETVRTGQGNPADARVAHLSAGLVHLGEIAYRTGRALQFDPEKETFLDDPEAEELLSKDYRRPWTLPDL